MKQLIYPILALLTFQIQAQTVTTDLRPMVVKKTATWCSICGSSGWTNFKDIISQNGDNATYLSVHSSTASSLFHPDAIALNERLQDDIGQPYFFVNAKRYNNGGSSTTQVKNEITALKAIAAKANTGFTASISGKTVSLSYKTEALTGAANGFLSIALVEDKVVANQTSQGSNAVHPFIFRRFLLDLEAFNLPTKGANATGGLRFDIPANYKQENLYVMAILWEPTSTQGQYNVINTFWQPLNSLLSVSSEQLPTAVQTLQVPTLVHQKGTLTLELNSSEEVQVQLFNLSGQLIATVWPSSKTNQGTLSIPFEAPGKGLFLMEIKVGAQSVTRKIVFE